MQKFNGQVSFINEKPYNGKTLHSFKLEGQDVYFGTGFTKPEKLSKGALVSFEAQQGKASNSFNVELDSFEVTGQGHTPTYQKFGGKTFTKSSDAQAKDDYWKNREAKDVLTQATIQLQSSRNSAIAAANLMLQHGAVNMEKVKQADKMDVILALVRQITDVFQEESAAARTGPEATKDVTKEPAIDEAW